nr:glycosyltransferase [Nitrosomonas nitrosa]
MRVLHLVKSLDRGGAEVLLVEMAQHLDPSRYSMSVGYFLPQRSMMVTSLEECGVGVHCFGSRTRGGMFASIPAVVREVTRVRPHIIHCHLPLAGVVGRVAGLLTGVPVIYTEHNLIEHYHPLTRALSQATWKMQRQVIAVSQEVRASIQRNMWSSVPAEVIQNAVSFARLQYSIEARVAIRRELGIPEEGPVVGTVAVFRPAKRLDIWLDIAQRLLRPVPDCHFIMVGWGPLEYEVRSARERLGLERRLHLVGPQSDVARYLSAMDLFMLTSDFEGLPVALLEAMAMRLPVVATRVGGVPEVVEHGFSGWTVERGDAEAILTRVQELLADPARLRQFGSRGRQIAEERFSIARYIADIERVYREVIRE